MALAWELSCKFKSLFHPIWSWNWKSKLDLGHLHFRQASCLASQEVNIPYPTNIFYLNKSWMGGIQVVPCFAEEAPVTGPSCSSTCPEPCGSCRNRLSISIDPFLSSKCTTSNALLNRIFVLQLALVWSSGLSLTLARQRYSVWSWRWSQETWRRNWGDAGSPFPLDSYSSHRPAPHSQVPGWKIKEEKKTEVVYPDRTCLMYFFFS